MPKIICKTAALRAFSQSGESLLPGSCGQFASNKLIRVLCGFRCFLRDIHNTWCCEQDSKEAPQGPPTQDPDPVLGTSRGPCAPPTPRSHRVKVGELCLEFQTSLF